MTQPSLEIAWTGQEAIIHIDEAITLNNFTLNLKIKNVFKYLQLL
jgi:hypothetical protein